MLSPPRTRAAPRRAAACARSVARRIRHARRKCALCNICTMHVASAAPPRATAHHLDARRTSAGSPRRRAERPLAAPGGTRSVPLEGPARRISAPRRAEATCGACRRGSRAGGVRRHASHLNAGAARPARRALVAPVGASAADWGDGRGGHPGAALGAEISQDLARVEDPLPTRREARALKQTRVEDPREPSSTYLNGARPWPMYSVGAACKESPPT